MNDPAINTSAAQTLELRDIQLPDPVAWWPLAPGWWLLLAVIIVLLVIALISFGRYRNRRHWRRLKSDIRSEIDVIRQRFGDSQDPIALARSLSILMRRASISYFPEQDIAGLIGERWLEWLDSTGVNSDASFNSETGRVLLSAPYMPDDSAVHYDADTLLSLCESWLSADHSVLNESKAGTTRQVTHS